MNFLPIKRLSYSISRYIKSSIRLQNSTVLAKAEEYQVNDKIHGFTINNIQPIPDLHLTTVSLTHDKTGAHYLHVARDDRNNVFCVGFRTTPMDNTGVPHILEHTTLCGSKLYPCRDPFFKMLNRSLSTFMNAMTGSDYTLYPFSTQNAQDFENLLSVYLDAVFSPQLRELDFWQEGWRLEYSELNNNNSPIIFKGIVFNEMKGVFSDSQQVFARVVQNKLYPSHTYSYESGGDPEYIPDLTWDQLKQFHATHYHPSNSRFYTYGDLPLERHLEFINERYLKQFSKIEPNTSVPDEIRWTKSKEDKITCKHDPFAPNPEKQTTITVGFLLGRISDSYENFLLSILGYLLTHGPTSPFYQTLLESNIGSDYCPVTGFNNSIRESSFCVGLQGIYPNDVEKVKSLIDQTFDDVVRIGFPKERIEAVLHLIEIGLKHQKVHFGLNLIMGLIGSWNHGGDPVEDLKINKKVLKFRKCLEENPHYLQDKIKQYFKDNKHKLVLVMSPEKDYEKRLLEKEALKLNQMVNKLSDDDKKIIYSKGHELAARQNEEEDISSLPTLKISDIEKTIPKVPVDHQVIDGVPVQICLQPTNGVTYFKAIINTNNLPTDVKQLLPLFCDVVTKMGAGHLDYKQLTEQIDLKTGGLSVSHHISCDLNDVSKFEQGIVFSSLCLDRNIEEMFNLWASIFNSAKWLDFDRLATLIKMSASELSNSITFQGHSFAMTHAASSLNPSCQLKEQFEGMTQVNLMKEIANMTDLTLVMQQLKGIGENLLNRKHLRSAINLSPKMVDSAMPSVEKFLRNLKGLAQETRIPTLCPDFHPTNQKIHFSLPLSVNFVSKCLLTSTPFLSEDYASLKVLSRLMTNKYLHREIREKGGAYGGGSRTNSSGLFTFFSYRDPNSLSTLRVFDNSIEWAKSGKFSQQDIDEAKLSCFAEVDKPIAPGDKAMNLFLRNLSDDEIQIHREHLFKVSKEHLVQTARRYLITNSSESTTFLGPKNTDISDNSNWTVISCE